MKKTMSMLLAICMMVALIAMPVAAKADMVSVQSWFDLESLEAGTVLSSEDLATNPVLKYAGVGTLANANVTYTDAEGTEKFLINYNPLNFFVDTPEFDDGWSKVVVEELDGEKVLSLQAKEGVAGIAFQPLVKGDLAYGKTAKVFFEFNQPMPDEEAGIYYMTKNALGLALDNGEGLDFFEVNEPTDVTWNPMETDSGSDTRFRDNADAGYLNLTLDEHGYVSPAVYYTRTSVSGRICGPTKWSLGFAKNENNEISSFDAEGRKSALGKWYKVEVDMTLVSNGIKFKVYSNEVNATDLGYIEYIYPLTSAELADFDDSKLCVVLTGQNTKDTEGRMYVRNISKYAAVETIAPSYKKTNIDVSFEDMAIGTAPRNNSIFVGAGNKNNIVDEAYDSFIDEDNNVEVVYNPATTMGNPSGKVLAVTQKAGNTTWRGFRTATFEGAALQQEGGVDIEFDFHAPVGINDGRIILNQCDSEGNAIDTAYASGDKPNSYYVAGHLLQKLFAFTYNQSSHTEFGPSLSTDVHWVRYHINYSADENGYITVKWYSEDLATGDISKVTTRKCDVPLNIEKLYNFVFAYKNFAADGSIYFDNIKLTNSVADIDTKVYSAEDINSVYGSSSEFYVELPRATNKADALVEAVTVKDSADDNVEIEVSSSIVNGVQVLTIIPVEGLIDEEVYTVSFGGQTDLAGNAYADVKFKAIADWNPYDAANPAVLSTDMAEIVSLGDEITITLTDESNGEYASDMYSVTSTNPDVLAVSDETGVWVATVVGVGQAELHVKNLIAPAEAKKVLKVETTGFETSHIVTFVDGENSTDVTVGDGWFAKGPETNPGSNQIFDKWAIDAEGTQEADLTAVKSDMTVYAVYSAGVTVTFRSNDETLGTVEYESAGIPAGASLETIPAATATSSGSFVAWEDAEGNTYTKDELLALTFDEDAEFIAVFKKIVLDLNRDYDFTTMTEDDLKALSDNRIFTNVLNDNTILDENGLSFANTTYKSVYLPLITEGVYALELDYIINSGSKGADFGFCTSSGKTLQGFYPVGAIHIQNENGTPVSISGFGVEYDKVNKAKIYFDFDNGKYYVVNNGAAGIIGFQGLLNEKNIKSFNIGTKPGFTFQRMAFNKVENFEVATVTISFENAQNGTASFGLAGNLTTATVPANTKVMVNAKAISGIYGNEYNFDGWTVVGGTAQNATALETFVNIEDNEVAISISDSVHYITHKYEETEFARIIDNVEMAEQTFQWGLVPPGQPVYEAVEGYELIGVSARKSDGTLNEYVMPLDLIATNRANANNTWVPVVKKIVDFNISSSMVSAQRGDLIDVPFKASANAEVTGGSIVVSYDAAALEYVGAIVDESLETEAYVKKIADGKLEVIVRTDDTITLAGAVATLKFKAIASGTTTLTFDDTLTFIKGDIENKVVKTYEIGEITISALKGDVNFDGKVNIYDAIAVLSHISNIESLGEEALAVADVNADDAVDVLDATQILKYIARIISTF